MECLPGLSFSIATNPQYDNNGFNILMPRALLFKIFLQFVRALRPQVTTVPCGGRRLGVVWVSSIPSRGALLTGSPCEQLWARGLSSLLAAASLSSVVPSHHLIALSALPQLASSHSSLIDGPTISSFPSSPPPLLTLSFLLSTVPGSQTLLSVPSLPPLSSPYQTSDLCALLPSHPFFFFFLETGC